MEGGAVSTHTLFTDIGDYQRLDEIFTIGGASVFTLFLVTIATRIGNLGGLSLNTYFDMFGLEGVLSNTMLLVILIQIARYLYTTLYTSGGKAWSPLVFLCFVLIAQVAHDVLFYYGIINVIPAGVNEMVDVLRAYAKDNSYKATSGHVILIVITSVVAMIMNDLSIIARVLGAAVILYMFPYILSIVSKKPAPPSPPPKKEEFVDHRFR
jgi:hypothetical protein